MENGNRKFIKRDWCTLISSVSNIIEVNVTEPSIQESIKENRRVNTYGRRQTYKTFNLGELMQFDF